MNKPVDLYVDREIIFIESEKFSDSINLPNYKYKNLVVIAKNGKGRNSWLDFGALCFRKKTATHIKTHACKVVLSTLDKNLETTFNLFMRSKLSICAATSTHSYHSQLKDFSNYYFENLEYLDLNNYEQCCNAYGRYTQILLIKKAELMASEKEKGFIILAKRQHVFAELICLFHNKDIKKFKSAYISIKPIRDHTSVKSVGIDELSYFYEVNKRIFHSLTDFLMQNKKYPYIFDNNIIEEKIVHYPRDGFFKTISKHIFNDDKLILDENEFRDRVNQVNAPFGKMSVSGYKEYLEKMYHNIFELIQISNQPKSGDRAKLINYAVSAFAMCFYCESSINPAQLYEMEMDDLSNYTDSIKGFKLFAIKPRASYKSTELLISVKMLPLLSAYKEFRTWSLSLTNNSEIKKILFSLNTKLGAIDDPFDSISIYTGSTTLNYKRWVFSYMPSFEWIIPAVIRKSVSNYILSITESKAVASKKLGNIPSVVSRHYSEATEKDFNKQLSEFFHNIYDQAANKYRKDSSIIDVNININGQKTAIGSCMDGIPKLNSGFTNELEKPNCSNPSSCLFCENYVVHSDKDDIRKLMSLKKILNISEKTDESLIVTKRINEIFKILIEKYPETKGDFISVANSVELGEFDEYWQDHLNLLLELGVNFYA